MLKKLLLFTLFSFFILLPNNKVFAISNDILSKYIIQPKEVGNASYYFGPFKIYNAQLYNNKGVWNNSSPYALKLVYNRNIKGSDIVKTTIDEMVGQGIEDKAKLDKWKKEISKIFPDVSKGSELTGILTKDSKTYFYKDDNQIGYISDPEFGKAFFDIWLGKNTSRPNQRNKLIKAY